ncbi:MAG: DUF6776 family protein [Gammaproteobacteria bacterium]
MTRSQLLVLRGPAWLASRPGLALIVIVLLAFLAATYAVGRWHAGFDARRALDARSASEAALRERDATIVELRRQVAELDTLKAAQERERQEVSKTIGELQAEVARQSQQLDFLRGVVAGGAAPAPSVAIRELRVVPAPTGGRYLLRIALARPGRPEREVTGSVRITVEGQRNGRLARLELREVSPSRAPQLTYRFLYFENLEQELVLPTGFQPERVLVEVLPAERGAAPVTRTLLWAVDGPT